ncbi:MAG: DUF2214 family protein [Roseiarcus sp.]
MRRLRPKGPEDYTADIFFWAKTALFAIVTTISAAPKLRCIVWRRAVRLAL